MRPRESMWRKFPLSKVLQEAVSAMAAMPETTCLLKIIIHSNLEEDEKMKRFAIFSTIAVMALAAVSCNKEMTPEENAGKGNTVRVTVTTAPELAMDTRTVINQDPSNPNLYIPSWLGNEKMGIWVDELPAGSEAQPDFLTNEVKGDVATFTGSISIGTGTHTIYGYASSADEYFDKTYDNGEARFDIPQVQHPTLTSFDSDADLLIAKAQTVEIADGQSDITIENVQFSRAVAVLKVILKDESGKIGSDAIVKSVTLTPEDVKADPLTGGVRMDMSKGGAITQIVSGTEKNVTAEYSDGSFVINGENAVWYVVNPLTFGESSTLTLSADAGKYVISKTLDVSGIELKRGDIVTFDVALKADDVTVVEAGIELPFVETFDSASSGSMDQSSSEWDGGESFDVTTGNVYEHGRAVRLGTNGGAITTKSALDLSQAFSVVARGTGWDSDEKTLVIVAGSQTKEIAFTGDKSGGIYEEQYVTFEPETNTTKVTFKTPASKERVLLDNIEIIYGVPSAKINSVETESANKITETTATLNGVYDASFLGEGDVVKYGFEWGTDASALTSVDASDAVDGEFSYDLSDLVSGTTYTFKAWAQLNDGEKVYGEALTFVPSPNAPWEHIFESTEDEGLSGKISRMQSGRGLQLTESNGDVTYTKSDYDGEIKTVTLVCSNNASKGSGTATVTVGGTALKYNGEDSATISGCGTTDTEFVFESDTPLTGEVIVHITASVNSVYWKSIKIN